jgi:hypothetical protein
MLTFGLQLFWFLRSSTSVQYYFRIPWSTHSWLAPVFRPWWKALPIVGFSPHWIFLYYGCL